MTTVTRNGAPVAAPDLALSPVHRALLRAALLPPGEARAAFAQWCSMTELDYADEGSRRILPLLYRNLSRVGVEHPWMSRLRGLYRRCWYRNQMLLADAASVLRILGAAGIPTLTLKGAALVTRYYRDVGAREMADADVAVPRDRLAEAVEVLRGAGWDPVALPRCGFDAALTNVTHAWSFRNAGEREVDLHWFVTRETGLGGHDNVMWERAVPAEIAGAETRALDDTDTLLHVLVHGMRWNPVAPLRWVADAATVTGTGEVIHWDRLTADAGRLGLAIKVREALECLRSVAGTPVPEAVIERLRFLPVSRFERAEHRAQMREPGLLGGLPVYWYRHRRARRGPRSGDCPPFFRGLACYWGTEGALQLAGTMVRRAVRRIRMHRGGSSAKGASPRDAAGPAASAKPDIGDDV